MGDDEGTWLSYHGGGFTNTGIAYLLNLKNNKNRLIDDPMQTELRDVVFGKMEPWKFTALGRHRNRRLHVSPSGIRLIKEISSYSILLRRHLSFIRSHSSPLLTAGIRFARLCGIRYQSERNNRLRTGILRPSCERMGKTHCGRHYRGCKEILR